MHELPELLASDGWRVIFINLSDCQGGVTSARRQEISGRAVSGAKITLLRPFQTGYRLVDRVLAIFLIPLEVARAIAEFKPEFVVNYAVPTGGPLINLICRAVGLPSLQRHIDYSPGLRSRLLVPLVALAERLTLMTAAKISTHNPHLRARIERLTGRSPDSISIFPPPIRVHEPQKLKDCQRKDSASSRFKVNFSRKGLNAVFIGTLFEFSGIRPLVAEWTKVFGRQSDYKLHIFGSGKEADWLLSNSAEFQEFGIHFYGFLDFECLQAVLGQDVVGIVPFELEEVASFALPNKALQYMAYGSPTVSTALKGLMSSEFAQGVVFVDSLNEMLQTLIEFQQSPRRLREQVKEVSKLRGKFGYASATNNLLKALGVSEVSKMTGSGHG